MTLTQAVRIIQAAYPQVYLACHTRHQRKRSTEHRLSQRDSAILAHLDEVRGVTPAELARHLGIARSTLSEALKRLVALGYVQRAAPRGVLLTMQGVRALHDTSVLEPARLAAVLERLSPADLQLVCAGMERLAAACRAPVPDER